MQVVCAFACGIKGVTTMRRDVSLNDAVSTGVRVSRERRFGIGAEFNLAVCTAVLSEDQFFGNTNHLAGRATTIPACPSTAERVKLNAGSGKRNQRHRNRLVVS